MDSFKLDRTAFKGRTLNQAADHAATYKKAVLAGTTNDCGIAQHCGL